MMLSAPGVNKGVCGSLALRRPDCAANAGAK